MKRPRFRLALLALLMLLAALPAFTAGPQIRKRVADSGGSASPEVNCRIVYRYICSTSNACASDSSDSACCNDCRDEDGAPLPCGSCTSN